MGIYEMDDSICRPKKTTVLEYKERETWKGKACSEAKEGDQQGMPSVVRLSKEGNKLIPKRARRPQSLPSVRCSSSSVPFPPILSLLIFKPFPFHLPTLLRKLILFALTLNSTSAPHLYPLPLQTTLCEMFHVAARPGQQHHYEMYQHQHPAAPLPNLQLPRTLNRPAFAEVQREAILAVEPNLGQVPFEYIRKGLHSRGEEYVQTYRL